MKKGNIIIEYEHESYAYRISIFTSILKNNLWFTNRKRHVQNTDTDSPTPHFLVFILQKYNKKIQYIDESSVRVFNIIYFKPFPLTGYNRST